MTNAKTDERDVLVDLFDLEPGLLSHPDGLIMVVDKGYRDAHTEAWLNDRGVTVIRPAYRGEQPRPGRALLRAVRQSIGGRTCDGVTVRILQRILALTAAIWQELAYRPADHALTHHNGDQGPVQGRNFADVVVVRIAALGSRGTAMATTERPVTTSTPTMPG